MKYILRKCFCNIELQNAAMIWGVLASVCSGLLLITALSTNVFMDRIYVYGDHNYGSYYYATTRLYWILVVGSTLHLITSIFLAIGAEKVSRVSSRHVINFQSNISQKNELMFVPWMIVQSLSAISLVPIVFVVVMVAVVVCKYFSLSNFMR